MRRRAVVARSPDHPADRGQQPFVGAHPDDPAAGAPPGADRAPPAVSTLAQYLRVLEGDALPYPRALGQLRRERGLSVAALARASGVGRHTIGALEAGRHGARASTILRLASALDVQPLALVDDGAPTGTGEPSRRAAARAADEASKRANGSAFYRRMGKQGGEVVKAAYGRELYVDIGRANGAELLRRRGVAYFRRLRADQLDRYPFLPKLRDVRVARGLTQRTLARLAGMSHSTVRAIEERGSTRPTTALKLAETLGVSPNALS